MKSINIMQNSIRQFIIAGLCTIGLFANGQSAMQRSVDGSSAATKMTLQQAVDMALKNNISVKQTEVQVQNAELNLQQSKFNQLPNASGNVNEFFNFGRSLDPFTNSYVPRNINYNQLTVQGGVLLYNGYLLKNTISQNDILLKATQQDMQAMKDNVALQVVLAYLNILNAEDQMSIAKTQTEITKLQIERTDKLVRAGSLAQSNLLDLKAQLANEETTIVNFQSQLELAKLTLLQLLNDKNISDVALDRISVPTPSSTGYDIAASKIYDIAESGQPLIKAADLRVKSAEKGMEIARAGFMPQVSINGNLGGNQSNAQKEFIVVGETNQFLGNVQLNGQTYPLNVTQPKFAENGTVGYFKQLENTFNYGIGLNINIPIFSKFINKTRVLQANLQRTNALYESQKTRQTLRQNIETAYTNMSNAAKRYESILVQVTALEESFRASESRFNAGAIDFVAYSLQKTNLDKARANLVQAKYDYVFRTKILDFYQNKPLTF
jgi:outer membrane protein